LTTRIRDERRRYATLRAPVRPGSSIAVISAAPHSGCSTVAALLARAYAEVQGDRVLAVDAAPTAGLTARLATRAGALDEVLRTLGIREPAAADGAQPTYRWLRSRLDIAGGLMVLAPDSPVIAKDPPLTENEYPSVIRRLGRWFPLTITDVDPAYPELLGSVISTADRILIVATADENGLAWLNRALTWLSGPGGRTLPEGKTLPQVVVSVLVQPAPDVMPLFALPTPAFVIPYDDTLRDAGTLSWQGISPLTREAVLDLAAEVAVPLRAG
jgi:MinD-like ATPase involved in chromosome partitioning or flagellar assembly